MLMFNNIECLNRLKQPLWRSLYKKALKTDEVGAK